MARRLYRLVQVFACSVLFVSAARAQTNPNLEKGLKPFGSYEGGIIDAVSMTNGNTFVQIPLLSYPQRGGKLRLNFALQYNNKAFKFVQWCDPLTGSCTYWVVPAGGGVDVIQDQGIGVGSSFVQVDPITIVFIYTAYTADGSTHQLAETTSGWYESIDGSGISYNPTTGLVMDRAGIRFSYSNGVNTHEDPNGNQISESSGPGYTDTLGRAIPAATSTTDFTGCTGPLAIASANVLNLPGPAGGTSVVKVCYANVSLKTNFFVDRNFNGSVPRLQSVVLPNNTAWTFEYNSRDAGDPPDVNYGDLTKITLPTGGTLSYTWTNFTVCSSDTTLSRWVTSRTLDANDGSGPHTWNYTWIWSGYVTNVMTNVVTDPQLNDTVYTVTGLGVPCSWSYYETQVQFFQGSRSTGTLLKTVQTDYSWGTNPYNAWTGGNTVANVVPIRVTTIWPNGKTSKVERDYDSGFTFKDPMPRTTFTYTGTYANVVAQREYDYGAGAPGALLRTTTSTYLALQNSNYQSRNLLDLVSSVKVQDGAGTQVALTAFGYDESVLAASGITTQHNGNPATGIYRGNRTSVSRWLNTTGGNLITNTIFYDTGMPQQATDPGGHATTFSYSASFAGAYLTQTQFPDTNSPNLAHHSISGNYDFNTGLLASFTDENGKVSNFSYDTIWRFTTASFPDGGVTNFFYPDAITIERQQKVDVSRWTDLFVRFDGLGREIRRITANDETTPWDQVDTCFDARGYRSFVSYPYQGTGLSAPRVCSGAGDSFTYDGLGRTTLVTHSDGSSVATSYAGQATQVTDEGNGTAPVKRITQPDGLGRLTAVCEVTNATLIGITPTPAPCNLDMAGTGFLTTYQYSYDPQTGNLNFTVQQGGLNARTSVQDSLSRLTSATNPESGTVTYAYNSDSLLITRQAPAPNQTAPTVKVTTTYTYDELHRPRTRNYTGGPVTPSATINYDESTAFAVPSLTNTLGRQSSSFVSSGTTLTAKVYSYDPMGRVLGNSQCTPQNCATGTFLVSYTYDLIGDLLTTTNGLRTTLTYSYNRAARLSGLTSSLVDANHPGTLLSNLHYNAFGGETSASLGNGVTEALGYTARGWLQSLTASQNPTTVYSFSLTFASNGNVLTANDSVNGNWTYAYDDFNRLTSAFKAGMAFTYDYDRFGNRWHQNGPYMSSLAFDANNRIVAGSGVSYDAAGNVTNDGSHSYTYDAENRITAVDGGATASYVYNAAGQRVRKTSSAGTVDYIDDLAGHVVTEVSAAGTWTRGEVYAGGRHVATYSGGTTGTTYFSHADWLGTERARSTATGASYEMCTSLPFGDWVSCTATDPSPLHFTGKERDSESGLDYFGARYYASTMGRWVSPDWSAHPTEVPFSDFGDPQTLNLYSYVRNNPLSKIDADGHCPNCLTAFLGGVAGAAIGVGAEYIGAKWTHRPVTGRALWGAGVKGALTGAAAGFTGGASLLVTSGSVAGANAVGGLADRIILGKSAKEVFSPKEIAKDAVSGAVGGALGAKAEAAGQAIAKGSAEAAAASGDAEAAAFYGANATAIGKTAGKVADSVQAIVESYVDKDKRTPGLKTCTSLESCSGSASAATGARAGVEGKTQKE